MRSALVVRFQSLQSKNKSSASLETTVLQVTLVWLSFSVSDVAGHTWHCGCFSGGEKICGIAKWSRRQGFAKLADNALLFLARFFKILITILILISGEFLRRRRGRWWWLSGNVWSGKGKWLLLLGGMCWMNWTALATSSSLWQRFHFWAPAQRDLNPSYQPSQTWFLTVVTLTCGVRSEPVGYLGRKASLHSCVTWLRDTGESNTVSRQRKRVAQPAAFPTVKFSWWKQTGFKADVHRHWSHPPTQEPISFCLFNKSISLQLCMNMGSFKSCIAQ